MSLRSLAPLVRTVDTRSIRPPSPADKWKDPFYNSPQFRAWRAQVVARAGGRCEAMDHGLRCNRAYPKYRMYADHITEIKDCGSLFDPANGQCLCASHHTSKTFAAKQLRSDLWSGSFTYPRLPRPTCRIKLICGPPAAGKSTYVRAHAGLGDIVIDLDMIARDQGMGRVRADDALKSLLQERNNRLAALAREPAQRTAWVILGAPTQRLRRWWCEALGVQSEDVVMLLPTRSELHRRVLNDPDRKQVIDQHLLWIDKWFMRETGAWPINY
jgi:5-methylcytosine-specific restriction enzyme A